MKWKGWEKVPITIPSADGPSGTRSADAIAPLIISASRSTDIPAFYGPWFMERLNAGYVTWKSPYGGKPVHVSFAQTRLFVFWTKNPAPFFPSIDVLDRLGYGYYFLFTLNDYNLDGLEPRVPSCEERIATFIRLSERIGRGRVVWRFDPLLLSDTITVGDLLDRIRRIGDRISPYTQRMVFSFVDIGKYAKVRRNLLGQGFPDVREFTDDDVTSFCKGLAEMNRGWNLKISACSERRDLSRYGVGRGQCISYDLIMQEFPDDPVLMEFFHPAQQQTLSGSPAPADPSPRLRDPGQRNTCRCIVSKDIGQYSTCMHLCAYCYANASAAAATRNYSRYTVEERQGIFHESILD